ncbi:alpha/beta fold hydrolase [Neobacillus sp. NRS-1170]|uniref:alpha/beta fold hydrolase n=1 Tax=Neobacillus sp. NRS-1170 TaxID=3233898 RepID=UPI003D2E2FFB
MIENTMKLPDGRILGYAEYGQPDGFPIIAMHGTPGARILGAFSRLEQIAQNISAKPFKIFVLERSGYGLSDPQPGRTIDNVVEDTAFFADSIGLEHFAIFGGSGGTPLSLLAASAFPIVSQKRPSLPELDLFTCLIYSKILVMRKKLS